MAPETKSPAGGTAGAREFVIAGELDGFQHSKALHRRLVAPIEQQPTSFRDSNEAAFRRAVCDAIRTSQLTKHEQAVTLAVANLWFHHRNGPEGVIRPGRGRLANKARVSVRTVATTLAKLREAGALVAVKYARGGRSPTRYKLRSIRLMAFCGVELPEWVIGELAEIARFGGSDLHGYPVQDLHTDISTVAQPPARTSQTQVAASLRVIGGRNV